MRIKTVFLFVSFCFILILSTTDNIMLELEVKILPHNKKRLNSLNLTLDRDTHYPNFKKEKLVGNNWFLSWLTFSVLLLLCKVWLIFLRRYLFFVELINRFVNVFLRLLILIFMNFFVASIMFINLLTCSDSYKLIFVHIYLFCFLILTSNTETIYDSS